MDEGDLWIGVLAFIGACTLLTLIVGLVLTVLGVID